MLSALFQWGASMMSNKRASISFALGIISVLSWGMAEVPQIITNFKRKSAEGLSIIFILTWILGDFLNLFGCLLEPATLPTQYYTAMLYTATTLILASQSLYYAHVYPRIKNTNKEQEDSETDVLMPQRNDDYEPVPEGRIYSPATPIPLPSDSPSTGRDLYFMSARSLTFSNTPPLGSSTPLRETPSDVGINSLRQPLLNDVPTLRSSPIPIIKTTLFAVSLICVIGLTMVIPPRDISRAKERLLLEGTRNSTQGIGSFLGWGMATIYLGGRLPQILLNKGNAEGLSPLMFAFALLGNMTYVASILVSSTEWLKVRPNLPWLVDAGGCVFLDILILLQFIYYWHRQGMKLESTHTSSSDLV